MKKEKSKMIAAAGIVFLFTALVWYKEQQGTVLMDEGGLLRPQKGEGAYEAELVLKIDDSVEQSWTITVPEQALTKQEEEKLLTAAIEEIEAEFAGENASLEKIEQAVVIRENYQNGKVQAEWEFSQNRLIDEKGQIVQENMEEDIETVGATVKLTCEDSSMLYEFYFSVCKAEKSEEEQFYEKLKKLLAESGAEEGTDVLILPSELKGHKLEWRNKKSVLPLQVFSLGMLMVFLLPMLQKEREKEAKKKREEQLLYEYPGMVNKLVLLLGAGMTLRAAWKEITKRYALDKKMGLVYEEMLLTQREIENGRSEAAAYEGFGERCGLQRYRKLSGYFVQNVKKGNRGLCQLLEKEAEEVFAERKNTAQRLGEEVSTKLLLPMLFMLGIVIVLIMIPAVLSFQTGIG